MQLLLCIELNISIQDNKEVNFSSLCCSVSPIHPHTQKFNFNIGKIHIKEVAYFIEHWKHSFHDREAERQMLNTYPFILFYLFFKLINSFFSLFMRFSVNSDCIASNGRMTDEFEGYGRRWLWPQRVLSLQFSAGMDKKIEYPNQDSQWSCKFLNQVCVQHIYF
jgi:hypothetical protein